VLEPAIGRGAMAEVRAAEDLRLGRPVAVKLLHASLAAQRETRLRLEKEARAAARSEYGVRRWISTWTASS
jgi:eukaryotic-like serine/threonine-protein kinase